MKPSTVDHAPVINQRPTASLTGGLSPQERLILSLAGEGLADKEIARKIGISIGTVRTYWQRMRDKTNARSRSEILALSLQRFYAETVGELQRLKNRHFALFEGSSVGLALLNDDQEIVEVNSAFTVLVGLPPAALMGLRWDRLQGLNQVASMASTKTEDSVILSQAKEGEMGYLKAHRQEVELEGEPFQVLTLIPHSPMPGLAGSAALI